MLVKVKLIKTFFDLLMLFNTRFLVLAMTFLLSACVSNSFPFLSQSPDLVVINAKVVTLDPQQSQAEAFAVQGGKFIAIGSNREISAMITPLTKVINARGKTVIPGLNDGHIHMVRAGMYWPYEVRMDDAKSIAEILERIRLRAQSIFKHCVIRGK